MNRRMATFSWCAIALGTSITPAIAVAQTGLQRTTINVPEDPSVPPDWPTLPPHAGVDLSAGPHRVRFDLLYGGVPRYWHLYGDPNGWETSLIWPNMGAAMQVVWDFGQDSTQGTPNGSTTNPISHPGDPGSIKYNYYARETLFQPPTTADPRAIYEVTGFGPFYWVSAEPREDCIPDNEQSWCTGYNGSCIFNPGWPLEFRPTGAAPTEGMLFVGHQFRFPGPGISWNQRLVEVTSGRVAFKIKVDVSQGSTSSFAGVMFRKQIPVTGTVTRSQAFAAPGYMILMNRAGDVNLHRQDGAGGNVIVLANPGIAPQAASRAVQLEIRTHNFFTGLLELFVDNIKVGEFTDPSPIRGPHVGLFAFTQTGTKVRFSDRSIYDVGYEFVARYTGTPEGRVESDISVRPAPFVTENRTLAVSPGLPGLQFNPYYQPASLDTIGAWDSCGGLVGLFLDGVQCSQICNIPKNNPVTGVAYDLYSCALDGPVGSTSAQWAGNQARTRGLYTEPRVAEFNGTPSPAAFAGVFYNPSWGPLLGAGGVSPVEFFQPLIGCTGPSMNSMRSVTRWSLTPTFSSEPVITSDPASQSHCAGNTAVLAVGANGTAPFTFDWYRGSTHLGNGTTPWGSVISGATTSTLVIQGLHSQDAGQYTVSVSNSCGADTSQPATLTVFTAPVILQNPGPSPQIVCPGDNAELSIIVQSDLPVTYRWRRFGVEIFDGVYCQENGEQSAFSGTGTSTLTLLKAMNCSVGAFDCIVTNACGSTITPGTGSIGLCAADFNCDDFLNGDDFDEYVAAFEDGDVRADFNRDGFVTGDDFDLFVAVFELGC